MTRRLLNTKTIRSVRTLGTVGTIKVNSVKWQRHRRPLKFCQWLGQNIITHVRACHRKRHNVRDLNSISIPTRQEERIRRGHRQFRAVPKPGLDQTTFLCFRGIYRKGRVKCKSGAKHWDNNCDVRGSSNAPFTIQRIDDGVATASKLTNRTGALCPLKNGCQKHDSMTEVMNHDCTSYSSGTKLLAFR